MVTAPSGGLLLSLACTRVSRERGATRVAGNSMLLLVNAGCPPTDRLLGEIGPGLFVAPASKRVFGSLPFWACPVEVCGVALRTLSGSRMCSSCSTDVCLTIGIVLCGVLQQRRTPNATFEVRSGVVAVVA